MHWYIKVASLVVSLMLATIGARAEINEPEQIIELLQTKTGLPVFLIEVGFDDLFVYAPNQSQRFSLGKLFELGQVVRRKEFDIKGKSLAPSSHRAYQVSDEMLCYLFVNILTEYITKPRAEFCLLVAGGVPEQISGTNLDDKLPPRM